MKAFQILNIGLLALLPLGSHALEPPAHSIWEAAAENKSWMGPFFADLEALPPWIHNGTFGWLYVGNADSYNLWLWEDELGWFYTDWQINPLIWTINNGWAWIDVRYSSEAPTSYQVSGWVYYYGQSGWQQHDFFAGSH